MRAFQAAALQLSRAIQQAGHAGNDAFDGLRHGGGMAYLRDLQQPVFQSGNVLGLRIVQAAHRAQYKFADQFFIGHALNVNGANAGAACHVCPEDCILVERRVQHFLKQRRAFAELPWNSLPHFLLTIRVRHKKHPQTEP